MKLTLARFVVLVHCYRVQLVVAVLASWKENQQSALSCLPQSVNERVCKLSGQRGVKRSPADSNKGHTFQSSSAAEKKDHASHKAEVIKAGE